MTEAAAPAVSGAYPRFQALVVDPVQPAALQALCARFEVTVRLRPAEPELVELARTAHVVVLRSGVRLTRAVLREATRLKVIARAGVGLDNIDLEYARAAGIVVFHVPDETTRSVAELTLGLLLAATRRIVEADRQVRRNIWRKEDLLGTELSGKRLGLIGVGKIGRQVGLLAGRLGMEVAGCVARPDGERRAAMAADGIQIMTLPELLPWADAVTLHLPLTARTRGLIGRSELARMRRGSYLINVSRGGIVDEAALCDALTRGHLAGAATDVHETEGRPSPLAGLDVVVLTPHIGAMTEEAQTRVVARIVDGIDAAVAGGEVPGRVC